MSAMMRVECWVRRAGLAVEFVFGERGAACRFGCGERVWGAVSLVFGEQSELRLRSKLVQVGER